MGRSNTQTRSTVSHHFTSFYNNKGLQPRAEDARGEPCSVGLHPCTLHVAVGTTQTTA